MYQEDCEIKARKLVQLRRKPRKEALGRSQRNKVRVEGGTKNSLNENINYDNYFVLRITCSEFVYILSVDLH